MQVINFGGDALFYTPTTNLINKAQVEYINNLEFKPKTPRGNRLTVRGDILSDPVMEPLKKSFDKYIDIYTKQVWGIGNKFKLCNSWASLNEPGASHEMHHHPNAIFSLTYYVQVKGGKIFFYKPRTPIQTGFIFDYDIIHPTEYNANTHEFSLNNGDICIFPAHVEHGTRTNDSSTLRVMIGANYFVTGKVGSNERLCYLET